MAEPAFYPNPHGTVNISASTSSASAQVYPERGPIQVRVYNAATTAAFIEGGDSTVTASTANSMPIGPGVTEVLTFAVSGSGPLFLAAILASGTGTVSFTPGRGS